MRNTHLWGLLSLVVLGASTVGARAGTIMPLPQLPPKVSFIGATADYTVGDLGDPLARGRLVVTGSGGGTYWLSTGSGQSLTSSTFSLTAETDAGRTTFTKATLLISGEYGSGQPGVKALFSTSGLLRFGSSNNGTETPKLQFLFSKGSGDFEGMSSQPFTGVDLLLYMPSPKPQSTTGKSVSLQSNFHSDMTKFDAYATPSPPAGAGLAVLLAGTGAVGVVRRRLARF